MRYLIFVALISLASAKPKPGGIWGAPAVSPVSYVQQPVVSQHYAVAQPVVHAAPAAVIAKPAATSYSSFQQVIHPVAVAQPVVHAAPVYSQPLVHAPVAVAQPVVHAAPVISQPVVQTYAQPYVSSVGHGW
ncbi:hypothetical protein evm_012510 [Chilo suppressalis]|nr:hypothetical protein evm_012510 [Chilo suppressalis]